MNATTTSTTLTASQTVVLDLLRAYSAYSAAPSDATFMDVKLASYDVWLMVAQRDQYRADQIERISPLVYECHADGHPQAVSFHVAHMIAIAGRALL